MSRLSALYRTIDGKLVKRNSWAEKNPEKKKETNRKTREKYREKLNKNERDRSRELRELSKKWGYCSKCYKVLDTKKYNLCDKCREYYRNYQKSYRRVK